MQKEKKLVPKLRFPEFNDNYCKVEIRKITNIYDGTHQTPNYVDNGVPFFSVEHVSANQFAKTKFISEEVFEKENKRVKLEKGDILMTRIGSIGVSKYIDWDVRASFYVSLALIKKPKKQSSLYLNQYISSTEFQRELWKRTIHVAFPRKINLGEIGNCHITLPTLIEQQKIAQFLTAIDSRIQTLEKKKSLLEQYKKGVMQKIFKQELRFKDDDGKEFPAWEKKRLGEYLNHKSNRNKNLKIDRVLSVSNSKGFILQSEQFDNHRVASKDVSNYKIVEKGDVAYNPSRINVGSIAILKDFDNGIISPMYVVFSLKNTLNINFFENIIKTHLFNHLVKVGCSGSVRDSLNFDDLESFRIKIPSLKEQTKIANFLSAIDKKIELTNQQIEHTKTYKKGLLQQMFV